MKFRVIETTWSVAARSLIKELRGRMFHVTSPAAFMKICATGAILNNSGADFKFNWTGNYYFKNKRCVSVVDLVNNTRPRITKSKLLSDYAVFEQFSPVVVFLFLSPSVHPRAITWHDWKKEKAYGQKVVPELESGILSFISILLIVYTIHQQSRQLASVEEETLKRDLLQHIAKADEEIERWLQRKLAGTTDGQVVEFGDVVWGLVKPEYVSSVELTAALERLLKLTCTYCGSIALCKDNINTHFIFQQHRQKAKDLVSFLEQHVGKLSQMAGPSLSICRNHLDG